MIVVALTRCRPLQFAALLIQFAQQFDAIVHVVQYIGILISLKFKVFNENNFQDKTSALLGLDDTARKPGEEEENLPDLFPFGL